MTFDFPSDVAEEDARNQNYERKTWHYSLFLWEFCPQFIFMKHVEIFLLYIMVTIDNACLNDVTPMAGLQQSVHVHAS